MSDSTLLSPLSGKIIVITRPRAQATALIAKIGAAGGQVILFPLLDIAALDDDTAIRECARRLADYYAVIFVSPNAVDYSLPVFLAESPWPDATLALSVGPGTAAALAAHHIHCHYPPHRFDSEALLELPQLSSQQIEGRRILIIRGGNGRPLLGQTLQERKARVDYLDVYKRLGPPSSGQSLIGHWRKNQLDAIVITSSEALRNLLELLGEEGLLFLKDTPLFVSHERILNAAKRADLDHVVLTAPTDEGLFAGLCAYNWHFTVS